MGTSRRITWIVAVVAVCLTVGAKAHALSFSFNDGWLAANADFSVAGSNLNVTLTNTCLNPDIIKSVCHVTYL